MSARHCLLDHRARARKLLLYSAVISALRQSPGVSSPTSATASGTSSPTSAAAASADASARHGAQPRRRGARRRQLADLCSTSVARSDHRRPTSAARERSPAPDLGHRRGSPARARRPGARHRPPRRTPAPTHQHGPLRRAPASSLTSAARRATQPPRCQPADLVLDLGHRPGAQLSRRDHGCGGAPFVVEVRRIGPTAARNASRCSRARNGREESTLVAPIERAQWTQAAVPTRPT